MARNSYEWTADVEGEIPYFCMVHSWMDGMIYVISDSTFIVDNQQIFDAFGNTLDNVYTDQQIQIGADIVNIQNFEQQFTY